MKQSAFSSRVQRWREAAELGMGASFLGFSGPPVSEHLIQRWRASGSTRCLDEWAVFFAIGSPT